MVVQIAALGRLLAFGAIGILLLSTGGQSGMLLESDAMGGHTAYLSAVLPAPGTQIADPVPLSYGLATLQERHLFGLIVRDRPLDASAGRMVFVWSEGAPDPRSDAFLEATGDWARVRDRNGLFWEVHEFRHGPEQGERTHYAYGVRVGDVHRLEDGTTYNHVLTYRPERLAAPYVVDAIGAHSVPLARGVGEVPAVLDASPAARLDWAERTGIR